MFKRIKSRLRQQNRDLTEGSIALKLAYFVLPLLLTNILQQLYSTIDLVIIGRFAGGEAFAAVGATGYLITLLLGLLFGLASGVAVNISQLKGAGNYRELSLMIHTAYALALLAGCFLMLIGISLSRFLLVMQNTPKDIIDGAERYLIYTFIGLLPGIIYNFGAAILQALGDSKRPLMLLILCSFVNLVLDLLFVAVLHMGIDGAAIATVLAQVVSAIVLTYYLTHVTADHRLFIKKIKLHKHSVLQIIKIGLPASLQATVLNYSNVYIQTMLNGFGVIAVAGSTAVTKIDGFFCLYFNALGNASTTFVGQNYGAKKVERIRAGVLGLLLFGLISGFVLCQLAAHYRFDMMRIFTKEEAILQAGSELFMAYIPYFFLMAFMEILSGALRGIGQAIAPMAIYIFGICIFRCIYVFFMMDISHTLSTLFGVYPWSWVVTCCLLLVTFLWYNKHKLTDLSITTK